MRFPWFKICPKMHLRQGLCPRPRWELTALLQIPIAGFGGGERGEEKAGAGEEGRRGDEGHGRGGKELRGPEIAYSG